MVERNFTWAIKHLAWSIDLIISKIPDDVEEKGMQDYESADVVRPGLVAPKAVPNPMEPAWGCVDSIVWMTHHGKARQRAPRARTAEACGSEEASTGRSSQSWPVESRTAAMVWGHCRCEHATWSDKEKDWERGRVRTEALDPELTHMLEAGLEESKGNKKLESGWAVETEVSRQSSGRRKMAPLKISRSQEPNWMWVWMWGRGSSNNTRLKNHSHQ